MSFLLDPDSPAVALLKKTVLPVPVAAELIKRYPTVASMLALNPFLDPDVFADLTWKAGSPPATISLIRAVPEEVAVRWVRSSDRQSGVTTSFLEGWVMGSDVQREFLRHKHRVLNSETRSRIMFKNLFDQELVFELLSSRAWSRRNTNVTLWLAHNPAVVDDDTFLDWMLDSQARQTLSPSTLQVLALMQRPHLAGALLDRVGSAGVRTVIEVDAPGNIDQLLELVLKSRSLRAQGRVRPLYRLACHPGLDRDLRAELCGVLERNPLWFNNTVHTASDTQHILDRVPSGDPAEYTLDELWRVIRFHADTRREQALRVTKDYGPIRVPVDMLEGLIAAAGRFRDVDPNAGPAVSGLLPLNHMWSNVGSSHRLLTAGRALEAAFPQLIPPYDTSCGTHREGRVPPPDSVVRSTLNQSNWTLHPPSKIWSNTSRLFLSVLSSSHLSAQDAANWGHYLVSRLGSAAGDTDKWVAFLHLLESLSSTVRFGEAVDVALAVADSSSSAG